jgi:class 3 adenylate cyclase/predicted ATPase
VKFSEIVDQASDLLRRKGRMTYRALKLEFELSDEQLEVLKEELIDAQELELDKDGKMLVWKGESATAAAPTNTLAQSQPPASYTPKHLADRILAEQAAMEARGSTDGERKTITALFADIKGSMALMEDLDPEDARSIIDPALALMMDAVHRYEGYVAQSTGDGIFAFFGAPIAHEDHPQRALFAALRMQEESRRLAERLRVEKGLPSLQIRVGINTGEVVMRGVRKDDLHTDYTPIGHSTGLASRMEGLATPGSVVVSEHTYKLTEGYFEFKPLGAVRVKGVSEPVTIYEVLGVGPLRTRLQVSARRGFTRFVGRQSELEHLRRALAQATAGHGQIVGVMGEPGLGKSRLFYEFKLTAPSGCLVLDALSVSYGKASPYLPLLDLLKSYFQIHPQDDERTRREKVGGKVLMLDRSLEETLPYLFSLLGLDEATSSLQQMDPQIRRQRTFDAIKKLFLRESLNQPLILLFEDLHWIDTETQGFLDTLSESVASACCLLLVNYRPEYRHEWGNKTYYTQLRLSPLGGEEAEELLTVLLGQDPSLKALQQLILAKTEGTPFFMEEVVQTLAEEGMLSGDRGQYRLEHAPTALHIPTTVQGVLAARIDRLAADEKALLHQLAVIGRQFPLSLVRQVVAQPEEALYHLLASLQHKEFLYEQPAFPEPNYIFKHALTQEVAYGTVLHEQRKALHGRTAQAIEALYATSLDEHYSELAYHYSRSGNTKKAVEYLSLTGQQAVQRSANTEAISHLTTALELLKILPDTPERTRQELLLQITLGPVLIATKGAAAPEVERAYTRARDLCQQMGDTLQLFPGLWGLWYFYFGRAEYQTAHELAGQLLSVARRVQDRTLLLEAYYTLGATLWMLGEWVQAREHLEQSLALYNPQQHHSLTFMYGEQDPGVICQADIACLLWFLGYPDQAVQKSHQALILAGELSHPFSLAFALTFAAFVHQYRREGHAAQERAEAAITLATEQGFPLWMAWGISLRGWALAEQGQREEGMAQMHQGLTASRAIGVEVARTWYLATLAEAYGKTGQVKEGLTVLAEALAVVNKTGERYPEAELYRLKGELTLQSKSQSPESPTREAEACFQKAIEIARKQQAKSLELRAIMSLSRLWQSQGKKDEARQMLAEIYNWFTEGFDTKDLQEARALLDELAEGV